MKKLIAIFLTLLLSLSLTACTHPEKEKKTENSSTEPIQSSTTSTPAKKEFPTFEKVILPEQSTFEQTYVLQPVLDRMPSTIANISEPPWEPAAPEWRNTMPMYPATVGMLSFQRFLPDDFIRMNSTGEEYIDSHLVCTISALTCFNPEFQSDMNKGIFALHNSWWTDVYGTVPEEFLEVVNMSSEELLNNEWMQIGIMQYVAQFIEQKDWFIKAVNEAKAFDGNGEVVDVSNLIRDSLKISAIVYGEDFAKTLVERGTPITDESLLVLSAFYNDKKYENYLRAHTTSIQNCSSMPIWNYVE